jgi:protein involved in polysaccharide export with SLBB domain
LEVGCFLLSLLLFTASAPLALAATNPSATPEATLPVASVSNNVVSNITAVVASPTTNALTAGAINSMEALDVKHKLAIGDVLSFRIVEDEEDPRRLIVTDSGELEVPYIGRFTAVGKTSKQLARELRTELEKDYYHQATVIIAVDVMARSRGKVYLVGPVRVPGPQEIPGDEVLTLSKAILRAGGFTDLADKKSVRVTRKGSLAGSTNQTVTVNVAEILEKGRTDTDMPLETDDLILIPERLIRF